TDLRGAIMRTREELQLDTKLTIGVRELFQANYNHALGFISALHMKVEEQLGIRTIVPREMKEGLEPAISDMGLTIEYGVIDYYADYTNHKKYKERITTHEMRYKEAREERRRRAVQQDDTLNYVLIYSVGNEKYEPQASFADTLSIQKFADILNLVRQQGWPMINLEEEYPPEPGADYSNEYEQVSQLKNVTLLMHERLQERVVSFGDNRPSEYQLDLNYFLEPYDLRVDVKPSHFSALTQDHEVSDEVQARLRKLKGNETA
ncbi:MAG TPA: hypothetical protein VEP90_02195, partial [Methylomirabilota bacterium]|nr:hypothetical protein [Methylomirabilota bacterium]